MRRSHRLLNAVVVLAAVAATRALAAQQIRGAVRDSGTAAPIPGVVVTVLDSAGVAGARAITDGVGRFTVAAPLASARLRLMRIGYRPRDVAIGVKRDGELSFHMEKIPPILERVRVSDTELCPGSTDRSAAFFLWEQARAGLLATVVARDLKPADARTLVYENVMSPNDETIRRQRKDIRAGRSSRPFVASAEPGYFARVGYMSEDAGGRLFSAPDADVLLHESFALTHCFRLQAADAQHRGQTGLAFSPSPGRDTLVDVRGVIWMDAGGTRLESLDFTYTSLEPPSMAIRPGGHIEFRTMENGVAFIERWSLRLPNMQVIMNPLAGQPVGTRSRRPPRREERTDVRVVDIIEAGGVVMSAEWPDGTSWYDTPAIATGMVAQRKSSAGIAGAIVTLVGTPDTTTTDNAGEFELQTIPGRYVVRVVDTTLQAFVKARSETQPVVVSRSAVNPVRFELPSIGDVTADLCRGQKLPDGSVILTGYAAMTDGSSLGGARVRGAWQANYEQATAGVTISARDQETDVDEDGRFTLCGVVRERPVNLKLFKGDTKLGDTTFRVFTTNLAHRVLWLVWPPAASVESATLEGVVVTDAAKTPIAGAEVSIPSLQRTALSGVDGAYRLAGIPAGAYAIQVRHVGDEPVSDSLTFEPRARVARTFALRRAVVLDTVRTRAAATSQRLRAFEAHRALGIGAYVADSALRLRAGRRLADVLPQLIQDLRIWRAGQRTYVVAPSQGRVLSGFRNATRCISTVYLDGKLQWDMRTAGASVPFSIGDYSVDDVAAVEFYGANAPLPAEYRPTQSPCGTLVLWSR